MLRLGRLAKILAIMAMLAVLTGQPDQARAMSLNQVKTWGYWLQNASIDQLVANDLDLYVIDYYSDGQDSGAYTDASKKVIPLAADPDRVLDKLNAGWLDLYRPGKAPIGASGLLLDD